MQTYGDNPTRAEQMVELAEGVVAFVREGNDREILDTWVDLFGFFGAAVRDDVERIGGAA